MNQDMSTMEEIRQRASEISAERFASEELDERTEPPPADDLIVPGDEPEPVPPFNADEQAFFTRCFEANCKNEMPASVAVRDAIQAVAMRATVIK